MTEKSLFEKIVDQEIPGYIVWENNTHTAFLNIFPLAKGHTLVVPKKNIGDYVFGLSEKQYTELWEASRLVAKLLEEKLGVERIFVAVEGIEVPHVHIHLIPMWQEQGLESLTKYEASKEELAEIQSLVVGK